MPPFRYDPGRHVVNGGSPINHGAAVVHAASGDVGIALKQTNPGWDEAYATQAQIKAAEPYYLQTRGECNVPTAGLTSPAQGDLVYITSGNVLTKTGTGNKVFGEIVEIAPTRGLSPGRCRIDLDVKSKPVGA